MNPKPEYLNEYIAIMIQLSNIEYVVTNYISLREEYYTQVQPRY